MHKHRSRKRNYSRNRENSYNYDQMGHLREKIRELEQSLRDKEVRGKRHHKRRHYSRSPTSCSSSSSRSPPRRSRSRRRKEYYFENEIIVLQGSSLFRERNTSSFFPKNISMLMFENEHYRKRKLEPIFFRKRK